MTMPPLRRLPLLAALLAATLASCGGSDERGEGGIEVFNSPIDFNGSANFRDIVRVTVSGVPFEVGIPPGGAAFVRTGLGQWFVDVTYDDDTGESDQVPADPVTVFEGATTDVEFVY
jgi:hypothetical protein